MKKMLMFSLIIVFVCASSGVVFAQTEQPSATVQQDAHHPDQQATVTPSETGPSALPAQLEQMAQQLAQENVTPDMLKQMSEQMQQMASMLKDMPDMADNSSTMPMMQPKMPMMEHMMPMMQQMMPMMMQQMMPMMQQMMENKGGMMGSGKMMDMKPMKPDMMPDKPMAEMDPMMAMMMMMPMMMKGMNDDPKAMGRMMQMRGEMMTAMGGIMLKYGTLMAEEQTSEQSGIVSGTRIPPHHANPAFIPDVELQLTATPKTLSIFPGTMTEVWTYQGKLLKGEARNLTELPQSYLGPIIRVQKGQKVRVFFTNNVSEVSIIHWHGLHLPEDMDGHPRYVIAPGETFVYEFEVLDRAGTYWYHPHPHELTGSQVYFGLAGLLIIEDAEEQNLGLPAGEFELPLVIQDRTVQPDGSLRYFSDFLKGGMKSQTDRPHTDAMAGMSGMGSMEPMTGMDQRIHGFSGETILVNGMPNFTLSVKTAQYRVRVLNGSNARVYKLALSHGVQFTVIGTDGGLLDAPVKKTYLVLGPGERIDALVDFSNETPGTTIQLRSMAFEGGTAPMLMSASDTMPADMAHTGQELHIADFTVSDRVQDLTHTPEKLAALEPPNLKDAVNSANPRQFTFASTAMQVTINGRTFEMDAVAPDEIVKLGTTEVWELINAGQSPMPHPVHIHGLPFRIISREGAPHDFKDGYVDTGWKDTVLLMPGEKVRILIRFEDFTGVYVYHCHLLEHEDLGMMRNYQIIP